MSEYPRKVYSTIGCCGLDCCLCPRYYTVGSSQCPGCCGPDFFDKHPSCSYITCCIKRKKLDVCGQCGEFPCSRFQSLLEYDSFISYGKRRHNLNFIQANGLEAFLEQQSTRRHLLETMLKNFDDGRSKNFYCIAASLLPIVDLETALREAGQKVVIDKIAPDDVKAKSSILRKTLNDFAAREGVELKLRKKLKLNG